jgi:Tfp pilus assembly PilM family ATPase
VLSSSQVQVFSISVKGAAPLYIKEAVEKMFGMSSKDIMYEYHAIGGDGTLTIFQVTTILKAVCQEFVSAFQAAGIQVLTMESIGHALSRSILPINAHKTAMVVDIDSDITTITIAVNGKVSQTTMFAFGDDAFTDALTETLGVSKEEANKMKIEQGLIDKYSKAAFNALADDCVALVHHINEEYIHWHTGHKIVAPLEHVYLTGAGSVLKGLDEYISVGLRVPVSDGNVWGNCLSFDDILPTLSQLDAVRYAVPIGAALTSNDMVNILPEKHKQHLQRKHVAGATSKILLSFIFGIIVGFAVARVIALPVVHTRILDTLHKIQARW